MIPASRSVKTVKKIINLPDPMVLDIDRLAIGDYSKRSCFVEAAIRTYRRDLWRDYSEFSMIAESSNLKLMESFECEYQMLMSRLEADLELFKRYESDEETAIGVMLTEELLRNIKPMLDKAGPLKNLQMFARLAVARELEAYEDSSPRVVELKGRVDQE